MNNTFASFDKYRVMKDFKEIADDVLMDFVDAVEKCKLTYHLHYGVCLGFVRDGNYIDADNDIDVIVHATYDGWKMLAEELTCRGFKADSGEPIMDHCGAWLIKDHIMLDVGVVPPNNLPLDKVVYEGKHFNVPYPVEEYLEQTYGKGWRKPHWCEPLNEDNVKYESYRQYRLHVQDRWRTSRNRWNKIADVWDEKKGNLEVNLKRFQIKERLKFAKYVRKKSDGNKVLDLGCGQCRDLLFFETLGLNCVGVDFSHSMLEGKKDVVLSTGLMLPFTDESFDGVWCNSVLKHLDRLDLFNCLREVRRVLKREGIFWAGLDEGTKNVTESLGGEKLMFHQYTKEEFLFLVRKLGFLSINTRRVRAWRKFIMFLLQKGD